MDISENQLLSGHHLLPHGYDQLSGQPGAADRLQGKLDQEHQLGTHLMQDQVI